MTSTVSWDPPIWRVGVESHDLIDVDDDVLLNILLKPSQLELDGVGAGSDLDEAVIAAVIGCGITADGGRLVGQSDFRTREHGAGGIGDAAQDAAAGALCGKQRWKQQEETDG